MIVLDSDVLIHIIDKKSSQKNQLLAKLKEKNDQNITTTAINLEEVLFGIFKRTGKFSIPTANLLSYLPILPFTREDAIFAAELEVKLEQEGKKKPRGDLLIAAITIRKKAIFFTLNKKHFQDIPNIQLIS